MENLIATLSVFTQTPEILFFVLFLCMLFAGEPVILGIAFYTATTHFLPFWNIALLAFISSIVCELFWFVVGRTKIIESLNKKKFLSSFYSDLEHFSNTIKLSSPLRLLFSSRLISGLTIIVIIFLSRKDLTIRTFIWYSILVNSFWTPIVVGIGFAAGRGYSVALTTFEGVRVLSWIGLLVLILMYIAYKKRLLFYPKD